MCVIIYKTPGAPMPTEEVLGSCWYCNPDGAGIAWTDGAGVHLRKGFRCLPRLRYALDQLSIDHGVLIHFRLGTSGGLTKGKTHPFPVAWPSSMLNMLSYDGRLPVIAHNGVLGPGSPSMSDTQLFVRKCSRYSADSKALVAYVRKNGRTSANRYAILFPKRPPELLGMWHEQDGLYFSNLHFMSNLI